MARRGSSRDSSVTIEGLQETLRAFNSLDRDLKRSANGELRQASKRIATMYVMPALGGSGSPQEAKILAAAGPKADRYVVVAVPNRKPALSGTRKQPAAMAKRLAFALEGGSSAPQFKGPAKDSLVRRHLPLISARAVPVYLRAVEAIARKYRLL